MDGIGVTFRFAILQKKSDGCFVMFYSQKNPFPLNEWNCTRCPLFFSTTRTRKNLEMLVYFCCFTEKRLVL